MAAAARSSGDSLASPGGNIGNMAEDNPSAVMMADSPPFPFCIIYNQSRHASNSVLADIRSVWGDQVLVLPLERASGGFQESADKRCPHAAFSTHAPSIWVAGGVRCQSDR